MRFFSRSCTNFESNYVVIMMYFLLEDIRHSFIRSDLFYSPFRLSNKHEYLSMSLRRKNQV